jgi:hypothetical protein
MSLPHRWSLRFSLLLMMLASVAPANMLAVSCTMQGEMTDDQRSGLLQSARNIALAVQSGNAATVRASTIPSVAAQFDSIANSIQRLQPLISSAAITIDAIYALDASDLKPGQEQTQFFCESPSTTLHEEITIPQLPPGTYGLALVHATGVPQPQQFALLLEKNASWQLAGFFFRPLLVAGHDSLWYWTRARAFAQKGEKWNAHFYYEIAAYLATPIDFLNTPNLEKLLGEQAAVKLESLPGEQPLSITSGGKTYSITNMHTDASLGGLDLVVRYTASDTSDPVATRAQILDLMKALLIQYPELKEGFHGLWVFAAAPNQRPFGIELPVNEIH